jgi:hypothetical protein
MATSFVSSMISGATCKRTTHLIDIWRSFMDCAWITAYSEVVSPTTDRNFGQQKSVLRNRFGLAERSPATLGGDAAIQLLQGLRQKCRQFITCCLSGSRLILMCVSGNPVSVAIALPFRKFSSGFQAEHHPSKSLPIILNSNPRTSWQCTLMPPNWPQGAKPPKDEASLRRKPFAEAGRAIARPFSGIGKCTSKWACGYRRSQDSGVRPSRRVCPDHNRQRFRTLVERIQRANIVILSACNIRRRLREMCFDAMRSVLPSYPARMIV